MKYQSAYLAKRGKRFQGILTWKDDKTWRHKTKMLDSATKTAAKRELSEWRSEMESTEDEKVQSGRIAVEYASEFIDHLESSRMVEPSTVLDYRHTMRMIRTMLKDMYLDDVTTQVVQRGEAQLLQSGLSPASVGKAHRLLKEICFHAVEVGDLESNPVSAVKPPKRPSARPNALDVRERARLIATIDGMGDSALTVAVRLATYGGMREGEVCGLRWEDVDAGFSAVVDTPLRGPQHARDIRQGA